MVKQYKVTGTYMVKLEDHNPAIISIRGYYSTIAHITKILKLHNYKVREVKGV